MCACLIVLLLLRITICRVLLVISFILRLIISRIMALIISLLTLICSLCILIHRTSGRHAANNAIVNILIFNIAPISFRVIGALGLRLRAVSTTMSGVAGTIVMLTLLVSRNGVLAVNIFRTFLKNATSSGRGGKSLRRWLNSNSRIRNIWFVKGRGDIVLTLGHIGQRRSSSGRSRTDEHRATECTKVRIVQCTTPGPPVPAKDEGNKETYDCQTNKSAHDGSNDTAGG